MFLRVERFAPPPKFQSSVTLKYARCAFYLLCCTFCRKSEPQGSLVIVNCNGPAMPFVVLLS